MRINDVTKVISTMLLEIADDVRKGGGGGILWVGGGGAKMRASKE
jgi:hypothetical protein